ncbi:MAG: hypothetical protein ACRELF_01250 [Gemmataceae bacterium]
MTALRAGKDYHALMELVRRYQMQGLSLDAAYGSLHQIWLEFGFDKVEEGSRLQDDLEYVMEKIWYECPAPER